MADRSNRLTARRLSAAAVLAAAAMLGTRASEGCPFCTPLMPTLSQSRAGARVTALGEVEGPAGGGRTRVKLHRVFEGREMVGQGTRLAIALDLAASPGTLLLLFGKGPPEASLDVLDWHGVRVDETSYAYFALAPTARREPAERLAYFARYLEHADPLVAEDAYLEFAHAPFDVVEQAAPLVDNARVGAWLVDPNVPGHRKGFYALVLGLAKEPAQRRTNRELLRELILAPEDDFRAGFDGVLGGYLLLAGAEGLELVESRYLADPGAADGDVRHALAALRFYHEYGREIPKPRICAALRHLLGRPEFAEAATIDLARWKDWEAADEVASLYARGKSAQGAIRRAVVGYLLACPTQEGAEALGRLRRADPRGVAEAEEIISRTGSLPRND